MFIPPIRPSFSLLLFLLLTNLVPQRLGECHSKLDGALAKKVWSRSSTTCLEGVGDVEERRRRIGGARDADLPQNRETPLCARASPKAVFGTPVSEESIEMEQLVQTVKEMKESGAQELRPRKRRKGKKGKKTTVTPEVHKAREREYQKAWRQRQDPKVLSEYRQPISTRWWNMKKAQDPEALRRYRAETKQRFKEKHGELYREKRREEAKRRWEQLKLRKQNSAQALEKAGPSASRRRVKGQPDQSVATKSMAEPDMRKIWRQVSGKNLNDSDEEFLRRLNEDSDESLTRQSPD